MGASEADKVRLSMDDALAAIANADQRLMFALTKFMRWAKTDLEAEIALEIIGARKELEEAKRSIAQVHKNGRRIE